MESEIIECAKLDRRKTMTMNWAGLGDVDDDDDRFFESCNRLSSFMPEDLDSSSDEDDDFEDSRVSFSSAVSRVSFVGKDFRSPAMSPDYDIWMAAPGSITERRRRLLDGLGLGSKKNINGTFSIPRAVSIHRVVSNKQHEQNGDVSDLAKHVEAQVQNHSPPVPVLLVRSRSDSDIEAFSMEKQRKEDLLGKISKNYLARTSSAISAPCSRVCPYQTPLRSSPTDAPNGTTRARRPSLTTILSNTRFGAFFLIKNLDTGKEFIVKEYDQNGMWNRLSDLQTGKQLTMEEFEKCVGYSPVVKELMRRENVSHVGESIVDLRKFNSYLSKSLRMSKRRGAALLKSIKGVANSMSLKTIDKETDNNNNNSNTNGANGCESPEAPEHKQAKNTNNNNDASNQWVKVRATGKSHRELSALHLCQEIQAHQGAIWTIKFSSDAHMLASAGEDSVIHVWEVQECEIMSLNEGSMTPLHPSLSAVSMEKQSSVFEGATASSEKKKKGKSSSVQKNNQIPEYVHVPETVFSLSEKPICSFTGHLDDVLDLSWSRSQQLLSSSMDKTVRLWDLDTKSCLKLFAHNDYVTCIQFNPMDDDYFVSGSLDAKVRLWNIPHRQVVDWTDLHEMVTAACYAPDGQGALIGSHKGNCRLYSTEDCKLSQTSQIDLQNKKKSQAKKITGFQFSPINPLEVLVTSADSRIRIVDGSDLTHKFKGFRNTTSQISASYTLDAKYVICASEDSNVYVWKREEPRIASSGKRNLINTAAHEHFQCKDVSAAVPWHGTVRGEPPLVQVQSKKTSRRTASSNPSSANSSPTREDTAAPLASKQRAGLPPLPKKNNNNNNMDRALTPPEEELDHIARTESGINDALGLSIRNGDSPSVSASARTSSSWSWFDVGGHGTNVIQPTAWGMVIVTATLNGEIRAYQNFGLPRRVGRQTTLF